MGWPALQFDGAPPYIDLTLPYQVLLVVALSFAIYVLYSAVRHLHGGFQGAGFTTGEATAILLVAPVLGLVNVPLAREGSLILAVNVGGALVPLVVAAKLVAEERAPRLRTLLATVLVSGAAYAASEFVPGEGVRVFLWPPIVLSVLLGIAFALGNLRKAAPLAYASGTLGILLGADLFRLPEILTWSPSTDQVASIGGGGALDAVFLVGVVAVALHLLLYASLGRKVRAR